MLAGSVGSGAKGTHGFKFHSGHIFKSSDFTKLMVKAVNHKPSIDVDGRENEGENEGHDVVAEDHVVDDAGVSDEERSIGCCDGQSPQPGFHSSFIFLERGFKI